MVDYYTCFQIFLYYKNLDYKNILNLISDYYKVFEQLNYFTKVEESVVNKC